MTDLDVSKLVNRAVIYSDPPRITTQIIELPVQEPGPGEVLIRLLYSGVCHTDYGFCTNGFSTVPFPTPKGILPHPPATQNLIQKTRTLM